MKYCSVLSSTLLFLNSVPPLEAAFLSFTNADREGLYDSQEEEMVVMVSALGCVLYQTVSRWCIEVKS